MNVLHICANPRPIEESASKQLAAAFFSKLIELNSDVVVNNVDLYTETPPYLSYDGYRRFWMPVEDASYEMNKKEEAAGHYVNKNLEAFRTADVLVLTMPMWNGGPPAIMKAWIDQMINPGVAYELEDGVVKPLHQLRKIVLLVASGDVYKEDDLRDGITPVVRNAFGSIGVTDYEVAWADGQNSIIYPDSVERKQLAIEAAQEIAEEIAELP
ncbi:MAG TPA: NAD(P)H-dependent oxidoreductase [Kiritimatiellia bacterium]|nr:NAD(P)H-dependent oxidoreductase [Kiritimatiellia bacterium]